MRVKQAEASTPSVPAIVPRPEKPVADPVAPRQRRWILAAAAVLVLGLGGLWYFQPWATPVPVVMVEAVAPGPVSRVLAVNGRVAASVAVEVRAQVSGTLLEVRVVEGDVVPSGTVLATIDPATQSAVVRQAMAGLDAALVAQADAQSTYDRTVALGSNAARVVLENAARAVQAAAQEVARMTALLDQAKLQLARFTIRAPIAGSVLVLDAKPGQTVDLATVLMTIADMGQLEVETDVDESYATQVKPGQTVTLQLAGESEVRSGLVGFVSQQVDEATGGLAIRLTPDVPLSAPVGLTVTANITVDDRTAAITVPRAAIIRDADGEAVLVAQDGIALRRAVTVIDWPAARLIVTKGLTAGDLVIADATGLAAGQAVMAAP